MSSQEDVSEILSKMSQMTNQDVGENIDDLLPTLISSLESEDKSLSLQAIQILLGKCLPCFPINVIENKIFEHALPSVKLLCSEALEGVCITLQNELNLDQDDVVDAILSLLHVCIAMVKCLESTLNYISENKNVYVAIVPSVPKTVASVLLDCLKHCRNSEEQYGDIFQLASEVIAKLFHTSHKVLITLISVLMENVTFNCLFEDELTLLTEGIDSVLDLMGLISECMIHFGVKAMADSWKGYISLAEKYSKDLKPYLNIAAPIKFLVADVVKTITSSVKQEVKEMNVITKNLKVASFQLKLIMKLCEHYTGYLSDCCSDLMQLLLVINRLSPPLLIWWRVPYKIVEEIEKYLTVGSDSLISYLIEDRSFMQEYFKEANQIRHSEENFGFIMLTIGLIKKLKQSEISTRKQWLGDDLANNLLCFFFRSLDYCHTVLCSEIWVDAPVPGGEMPQKTDVYGLILAYISAFIVTSSPHEFISVERILIENLLQPGIWRALLASDVWCVVARYGNADLCYQHTNFLINILHEMSSEVEYCRPEKVYVTSLVKRLFGLLPRKHKKQLLDNYSQESKILFWSYFDINSLEMDIKCDVISNALSVVKKNTDNFLSEPTSHEKYITMISSAKLLGAVLDCPLEREVLNDVIYNICKLWKCSLLIKAQIEEIPTTNNLWLLVTCCILGSVLQRLIKYLNNFELHQILLIWQKIMTRCSSAIKLQALFMIKVLADKSLEQDELHKRICYIVAFLFGTLLQDNNLIVSQVALEIFSYFAHVTKYEQIVKSAVSYHKDLPKVTTLFLTKQLVKNCNYLELSEYLKRQSVVCYSHMCKKVEFEVESEDEIDLTQECKKIKLDVNDGCLNAVINRLHTDSEFVVKFCSENCTSMETKLSIKSIINKLNSII